MCHLQRYVQLILLLLDFCVFMFDEQTVLLDQPHFLLHFFYLLLKLLVHFAQVLCLNSEPVCLSLEFNYELFTSHLKLIFSCFFLQCLHFTVDFIHMSAVGIHELFFVLVDDFFCLAFVLFNRLV